MERDTSERGNMDLGQKGSSMELHENEREELTRLRQEVRAHRAWDDRALEAARKQLAGEFVDPNTFGVQEMNTYRATRRQNEEWAAGVDVPATDGDKVERCVADFSERWRSEGWTLADVHRFSTTVANHVAGCMDGE